MSSVYCIRNVMTGCVYVGSTTNFDNRISIHIDRLSKRNHPNRRLQNDWLSYGENSFEIFILEEVLDDSVLISREQYWIDYYGGINSDTTYNMRDAGSSGTFCDETKKSISDSKSGVPLSEEHRRHISESGKGKVISEETRYKISESNKITHNLPEYIKRQSEYTKQQWLNPEYRELMTNLWKGRKHTDETRKKMSESAKRRANTEEYKLKVQKEHGKPVVKIDPFTHEIVAIYPSVLFASKENGLNHNTIRSYCEKNKILAGYIWRYANAKNI